MINIINNIRGIYTNLGRLPRSIYHSGMITCIACLFAALVFIIVLLVKSNSSPDMWFIANSLIKNGAGIFTFTAVAAPIINMVSENN
ncbi:MAG: hypothetical protein LBI03_04990 [Clostridiales bacterium]|jgi:hypothetical protein|nr:hypothetical protein [Clostridiales bacterium]